MEESFWKRLWTCRLTDYWWWWWWWWFVTAVLSSIVVLIQNGQLFELCHYCIQWPNVQENYVTWNNSSVYSNLFASCINHVSMNLPTDNPERCKKTDNMVRAMLQHLCSLKPCKDDISDFPYVSNYVKTVSRAPCRSSSWAVNPSGNAELWPWTQRVDRITVVSIQRRDEKKSYKIIKTPRHPFHENMSNLSKGTLKSENIQINCIDRTDNDVVLIFVGRIQNRSAFSSVSETFFHGGTRNVIVHVLRHPCLWKQKNYKETVVSALRLLQYFHLPDKNSRDISRYIYNFLWHFKIVMYLFHYFSRNPVSETTASQQLFRSQPNSCPRIFPCLPCPYCYAFCPLQDNEVHLALDKARQLMI